MNLFVQMVMRSLRRIGALVMKELRQLSRDRLTFAMIIGIPTLQILLFGYAINFDVRDLPAGVADEANTSLSRKLTQTIAHSQVLTLKYHVASASQLERLLARGEIRVGIAIPPDFERRLIDTNRRGAQLLVDGTDPLVLGVAEELTRIPDPRAIETVNDPVFEVRAYYNPERRSAVNTVPGLIGVILTLTMVLFTAIAIVREHERGNLEFLIATPMRTPELMIAKILPYIAIGLVQVTLVLWLGRLLFEVPIRGALVDLYCAAGLFIAASLALGLLISTLTRSQFQAVQLAIFVLMPSILISGFVFPFEGMPWVIQRIAELLPITHFMRLIKGIVLRGATLGELSSSVVILGGFTLVLMTLATLRFRKRLD